MARSVSFSQGSYSPLPLFYNLELATNPHHSYVSLQFECPPSRERCHACSGPQGINTIISEEAMLPGARNRTINATAVAKSRLPKLPFLLHSETSSCTAIEYVRTGKSDQNRKMVEGCYAYRGK